MMSHSCNREPEVLNVIRLGHWPAAADPALRAHVNECSSCSELALVAGAMQQSRQQTVAVARLASPGVIFWRAQLRRRNQALTTVARPIILAEVLACVLTLVALVVCGWRALQASNVDWSGALASVQNARGASAGGDMWMWTAGIAALATLGLFGAIAIYLFTAKE